MSTAPSKTVLPAILLANDLQEGDVVFWTGQRWSRDPAEALIAHDPEAAVALHLIAKTATSLQQVVDAYLVDVSIRADGLPVPKHFRERFKIRGPSNRPDLGKQATFDHLSGVLRDVSL